MENEVHQRLRAKGAWTCISHPQNKKGYVDKKKFDVLNMNRNLVSGNLLVKSGIKSVYELGKLVLSVNGIFVGKRYFCDGMIKFCSIYYRNNVKM